MINKIVDSRQLTLSIVWWCDEAALEKNAIEALDSHRNALEQMVPLTGISGHRRNSATKLRQEVYGFIAEGTQRLAAIGTKMYDGVNSE
jgi:hypothetical protein